MTTSQADEFLSKFKIVHQWSDNPTPTGSRPGVEGIATKPQLGDEILANTGLSATLIRRLDANGNPTNQYVLSIRSTEFRDWADGGDGERDTMPADFDGISLNGFALAQLSALEKYYQWLKDNTDSAGNALLPPGAQLDVTGYSLGGHLATVFTEIHQNDENIQFGQTVAFNAPGRGTIDGDAASLKPMLDFYAATLDDPDVGFAGVALGDMSPTAMTRFLDAKNIEGQPFNDKFIYDDARYIWAKWAAETKFNTGNIGLWFQNQLGNPDQGTVNTDSMARITHVYGAESINNTNVTANSGIHGQVVAVGIESQPLIEGGSGFLGDWLGGDFGTGHSIALLADSLVLQRAMHTLDAAYDLEDFRGLLKAATNVKPVNGYNANYEYDALENILDGLRKAVLGVDVADTQAKEGAGGFGDWTMRQNQYHTNLQALQNSPAFQALQGKATLTSAAGNSQLPPQAKTDFGAFLALETLSPVVITTHDAAAVTALQAVHGAMATAWQADKNARLYGDTRYVPTYSDTWYEDRAALLQWQMVVNLNDMAEGAVITAATTGQTIVTPMFYADRVTQTEILVGATDQANQRAQVVFGGGDVDTISGYGKDDRLYGGAGNDSLSGLGGDDYLEGNADNDTLIGGDGRDTLVGGAGADRYEFSGGFGADTVIDADGNGSLWVDGVQLTGGKFVAAGFWQSEGAATEPKWNFYLNGEDLSIYKTGAPGRLIVKGFKTMSGARLGLNLPAPEVAAQPGALVGDYAVKTHVASGNLTKAYLFNSEPYAVVNGSAADVGPVVVAAGTTAYEQDEKGNLVHAEGSSTTSYTFDANGSAINTGGIPVGGSVVTDNTIFGGVSSDTIYGLSGKDLLMGGGGHDYVDGGIDSDLIYGGEGTDFLLGGDGNDFLFADSRNLPTSYQLLGETDKWEIYARPWGPVVVSASGWGVFYGIPEYQSNFIGINDSIWGGQAISISPYAKNLLDVFEDTPDTLVGGAGNDLLIGGYGDEVFVGGDGDDFVYALDGNDMLLGGEGNDMLGGDGQTWQRSVINGRDTIFGGRGDDEIRADGGSDFVSGDEGRDLIYGDGRYFSKIQNSNEYNDTLYGGEGDDFILGDQEDVETFDGVDYIFGETGNDSISGGGRGDWIFGGEGDDLILGDTNLSSVSGGGDSIFGGSGNDRISGQGGGDHIDGEEGNDLIVGDSGGDLPGGDDTLLGGGGNDSLYGNDGTDWLSDGGGNDYLSGDKGNDTLIAESGRDVLDGGEGEDVLISIGSESYLRGGTGSDVYDLRLMSLTGAVVVQDDESSSVIRVQGSVDAARVYRQQELGFPWISPGSVILVLSGQLILVESAAAFDMSVEFFASTESGLIASRTVREIWESSQNTLPMNGAPGYSELAELQDYLRQLVVPADGRVSQLLTTSGDDYFEAVSGTPTDGGGGNDILVGSVGEDSIEGGAGDDTISGGEGGDNISGGVGSNHLTGDLGNDRYSLVGSTDVIHLRAGDGSDQVSRDWTNLDEVNLPETTIKLDSVESWDQLAVELSAPGGGISLIYGPGGDRVLLEDWASSEYGIQKWLTTKVELSNGQSMNLAQIVAARVATGADDVIYGPNFGAALSGGAGNDVFHSGNKDNVFEGGAGNDTLDGLATYLFSADWGHDQITWPVVNGGNGVFTLDFGQGIASGDVTFERFTRLKTKSSGFSSQSAIEGWVRVVSKTDGSSLEVPITNFLNPYFGSYSYRFKFADQEINVVNGSGVAFDGNDVIDWQGNVASYWDSSLLSVDLSHRVLDGQGGNDVLSSERWRRGYSWSNQITDVAYLLKGGSGNDTLYGAKGDTLEGGAGNDRLVMHLLYGAGSSYARFSIGDGQDTIESAWLDQGLEHATLVFGPDVTQQSIRAEWVRTSPNLNGNYHLVLHYGNQGDQVTLHTTGNYHVNAPDTRLRFSDGTEVSIGSVLSPGSVTPETDGDDVILGSQGQDSILSGLGNDRVVLDDSDSYTYRIGHGNDVVETVQGTIRLADVTTPSQVTTEFLDELGNELRISFAGSDQTLVVRYDAAAPWPRQIYMGNGSLLPVRVPTRFGTEGDDNVNGTNGDDDLRGLAGNDYLASYDGNDILDGGAGADYMAGGQGDDTYSVDTFASWSDRDQVTEGYEEGLDTIVRSVETNYLLDANVENLHLAGAARTGFGNELDNVLRANDAGNYLDGQEGNDTLLGGLGADNLWGSDGDDLIVGGLGNDFANAGAGNDVYVYNKGDGVDTINFSDVVSAVDTLRLGTGILEQDVVLQNMSGSLYLSIKGDAGRVWASNHFATATQDGEGHTVDNRLDRIEFASGAVWDAAMIQTMVDRAASNRAPTVNSGVSTPTLQAKAGALFSYTFAVNTVVDPDPWDSITYSATMSNGSALPSWLQFDANTRTLSGTPGSTNVGSLQFVLWGTDLYGRGTGKYVTVNVGAANRAPVVSAALVDQQVGPSTALTYTFASGAFSDPDADALTYSATLADGSALPSWLSFNASTRTFSGTAPSTLGSFSVRVAAADSYGGVVNDVFDIAVSNLGVTRTGTSAAETLTGTAYADSLFGMAGNDTLVGNAGNDTLDGGTGTDNMQGGAGDDLYSVDVSTDVVTEAASAGTDTVQSLITLTLGTNLENLTLMGTSAVNATGNAVANVLVGNAAANTLSGLGGVDTMMGGAGNDTYVVENVADVVVENTNEGTDLVQSSVSYTLSANVETLTLTGTSVINATGNTSNNQLTGNSGANVLDGGAGADTMAGGAGNDAYYVDNAGDVVTEAASAGTDTVYASVSHTLAANVERLTLTSSGAINATGNTLANTLTGNSGDNMLSGGTGADTMVGGLGNDTYVVDATTDVVTEAAGAGIDTIQSSVTLSTLAANVENLTLTGTSALSATGNTLDNVLTGNSGANTLTGGVGADTLVGGAGGDSLVGGAGNDTYRLGRGGGADTVTENDTTAGNSDRAVFDAGIAVEQLWFRRVSNNLEASIIGTSDRLTLTNWYLGSQYQVERFEASDGQVLLSSQMQSLVQAMAAFSPPASGQSTLPASYQTALNPVIAANWN